MLRIGTLQKETQELMEAFKNENEKLKNDVTWLANSAKNSKLQAEKALNDLEEYAQVLTGLEQKLLKVESEKEMKTKEVIEL